MSGGGFGDQQEDSMQQGSPLQGLQGLGMAGYGRAPGALMPETLDTNKTTDTGEMYFQPRFDYMYGGLGQSMSQYNPYTMSYMGADPMYGGYSPFVPQLPYYSPTGALSDLRTQDEIEEQERKPEKLNQFGM